MIKILKKYFGINITWGVLIFILAVVIIIGGATIYFISLNNSSLDNTIQEEETEKPSPSKVVINTSQIENDIITEHNLARKRVGKKPIERNKVLDEIAKELSLDSNEEEINSLLFSKGIFPFMINYIPQNATGNKDFNYSDWFYEGFKNSLMVLNEDGNGVTNQLGEYSSMGIYTSCEEEQSDIFEQKSKCKSKIILIKDYWGFSDFEPFENMCFFFEPYNYFNDTLKTNKPMKLSIKINCSKVVKLSILYSDDDYEDYLDGRDYNSMEDTDKTTKSYSVEAILREGNGLLFCGKFEDTSCDVSAKVLELIDN